MKRDSPHSPPHTGSGGNIIAMTAPGSSAERMGPHNWLLSLQSYSQRRRQSTRSTIPAQQPLSPKPRGNSSQQQQLAVPQQQASPTGSSSESRRRSQLFVVKGGSSSRGRGGLNNPRHHHSAPNVVFPPLLYTPPLTHHSSVEQGEDDWSVPRTVTVVKMILAVDPKKSPQSPQQQLRRSRSLNNDDSEGMGIMDSTSDEKKKNGSCDGCFYDDGTGDDGESDITLENDDDDDVDELDRYQKQQHLLDRSFYDSSTSEFGGENFYQHSSLSSSSNNNHVDDAERLLNQLMDEQDERRARAQQMQEKPSPVSTATTCLTQEQEEGKEAAVRCSWDLIPQPQNECSASVVSISSSVVLRRRIQGQGDMQDWGISSTPLEEDHSRIKQQQQQQLQQQPKLVQQQSRKPASLQRRSATTPGPHMISNDSEVLRIIPAIASQIMMRSKSSICLTDYHQYQYEHSINMNNSSSSDKVKIHPLYKQKSSSTSELGGGCQETAAPGHHHHARSRRRYPSQQQVEGTAGPQDLAAAADGGSSDYNAGDSFTRTHRRSSSVLCGNTVYVV